MPKKLKSGKKSVSKKEPGSFDFGPSSKKAKKERPTPFFPYHAFKPETEEWANDPSRVPLDTDRLFPVLIEWDELLSERRQLHFETESEFLRRVKDLGIPASDSFRTNDIERLWRKGWMRVDEVRHRPRHWKRRYRARPKIVVHDEPIGKVLPGPGRWGKYEFRIHPFRMYTIHRLLESMRWRLIPTNIVQGSGITKYAKRHLSDFRRITRTKRWKELLREWNGIADLAIMLEPAFWPDITGFRVGRISPEQIESYRETALEKLRLIPKGAVAYAHMALRDEAARLDKNGELYIVLRGMNWEHRKRVKGDIGAAMWFRHMAEVIRLGYDELYEDRLVHEDEGVGAGNWYRDARAWYYGSEYPLENIEEALRRLLPRLGLYTGAKVRFYAEGETEVGMFMEALGEDYEGHIEVVNFHGAGEVRRTRGSMRSDVRNKRYSFLMLDGDEENAVRVVKAMVRDGLVKGMAFKHDPDVEIACFSLEELIEAAGEYESLKGMARSVLKVEDFGEIRSGKAFEAKYCELTGARGLKGETWGRALCRVAIAKAGSDWYSHPLMYAFWCMANSLGSDYDSHINQMTVDPVTLENVSTGLDAFGRPKATN